MTDKLDMTQRFHRFLVNTFAANPKTSWGKKELELQLQELWGKFLFHELQTARENKCQ